MNRDRGTGDGHDKSSMAYTYCRIEKSGLVLISICEKVGIPRRHAKASYYEACILSEHKRNNDHVFLFSPWTPNLEKKEKEPRYV